MYVCISVFGPIDQFSQIVFHACFGSRGLQYFQLFKTSMTGLQIHELGVLPAPHIIWGPEFMYGTISCKTCSLCDGNFSWNVKQKADSYIMQQISLIQHVWDHTGAELSNIMDYQMVPILTYVLTSNFLFLLLYLGLHNYSEEYSFWISPSSAGSGSSASSSVFTGVFVAGEVNGIADKGSGDTTVVDSQKILEPLMEHVPDMCLFN